MTQTQTQTQTPTNCKSYTSPFSVAVFERDRASACKSKGQPDSVNQTKNNTLSQGSDILFF